MHRHEQSSSENSRGRPPTLEQIAAPRYTFWKNKTPWVKQNLSSHKSGFRKAWNHNKSRADSGHQNTEGHLLVLLASRLRISHTPERGPSAQTGVCEKQRGQQLKQQQHGLKMVSVVSPLHLFGSLGHFSIKIEIEEGELKPVYISSEKADDGPHSLYEIKNFEEDERKIVWVSITPCCLSLSLHTSRFVSGAESTVGAASHAGSVTRSVDFAVRMGGTTWKHHIAHKKKQIGESECTAGLKSMLSYSKGHLLHYHLFSLSALKGSL